jgi:hypothetical protein
VTKLLLGNERPTRREAWAIKQSILLNNTLFCDACFFSGKLRQGSRDEGDIQMNDPTVPAHDRYVQAIYNEGGTLQFSFDFPVYEAANMQLSVNDVQWAFTADSSVVIVDNSR